jgi:hypothetical protein
MINWNFKSNTKKSKLKFIRFRASVGKTNNYTVSIPKEYLKTFGHPNKVCFGVGENGVFISTKPIGTMFTLLTKHDSIGIVNSIDVVSSVLKELPKLNNETTYKDYIPELVEEGIWRLVPKQQVQYQFM